MSWGLDWWDDSPKRHLLEKIEAGARRYAEKYGHAPTTVYVAPEVEVDGIVSGLRIVPSDLVRPNHFFITANAMEEEYGET